jgi:hypothetical protein
MKSFRRILLLTASFAGLFLITGLILSYTYEDAVIKYLKKYLDKHLTTEIEVTQIKLSFIRKFPNVTVGLRNIVVYSGAGFQGKEFSGFDTDTLLSAKSVVFEFSLPGVLRHEYKLKNIRINDGKILLLKDSGKRGNFNIWEDTKNQEQEKSAFTLQNIILTNTEMKYFDLSDQIKVAAETKKTLIQADLKNTENHFSFNGLLNIHQINIGNSFEIKNKRIGIDLKMKYHDKHYTFYQSTLHSGRLNVNFDGEIKPLKNTFIALNLDASHADIKELENFYPAELEKFMNNYTLTDGIVNFKASINGIVDRYKNPDVHLLFSVRNASVMNQKNRKKVSGISIDGDYSNGAEKNQSTAVLNIREFSANQGKSFLNGALKMKGMKGSDIQLILKSEIQIDKMTEFLNMHPFEDISGTINTDIHLKGHLSSLKHLNHNELVSFNKEGIIYFNELSLKPKKSKLIIRKLNGNLILENIIQMRDVSFLISDNDFKMDGNLINLPQYLFNKEPLMIEAKINSDYLDIKSLLSEKPSDSIQEPFQFPERIFMKSDFIINKLIYGKFSADSLEGFVNYKPGVFDFENFRLFSADGFISGNATVIQTPNKGIAVTCSSKLGKIDIQKLFSATNNFGQNVILDINLMGELSGNLNFTSKWNSSLKLIDSSIIADSYIEIRNGQLIDYKPMLGLSRFVNVEELKDIKFKVLRNQISIGNNKVIIPEMQIHSSAFNIKGSGTHHFDNSYDYRIQVELNELLSNKARKRRKDVEEFGTIEDDGLGKLNLPVKITGIGNTYHVEFDRKKAASTFRKNIAGEREEIKNLFKASESEDNIHNLPDSQNKNFIIDWDTRNEKKDFIFEQKDQEEQEQPRFIIEWDEDDNTDNRDTTIF